MEIGASTSGTSEERVGVFTPIAQRLRRKQVENQKTAKHTNMDNGKNKGYVPKLLKELEKRRPIMKASKSNSLRVVQQLVDSACDYGKAAKVLKIHGSQIILKTAKSLTKSSIRIPSKMLKYKQEKPRIVKRQSDFGLYLNPPKRKIPDETPSKPILRSKASKSLVNPTKKERSAETPSKPILSSEASSLRSFQSSGHEPMDA